MRYVYWLFTVVITLTSTLSHAQSVDTALVGSWLNRIEIAREEGNDKVPVLLEIRPTGEFSLSRVDEDRGFLTTDPETWHLSLKSHGRYSVKNADAFSINSTISPGDWIELRRVPAGNWPSLVDPFLLPKDMNTTQSGTPQNPLNPALVGLWQATKISGRRVDMVWRVNPNGYSILITVVVTRQGKIEASGGKLKLIPNGQSEALEATYRVLNHDTFEMTDDSG